jgi:hypothetical protein
MDGRLALQLRDTPTRGDLELSRRFTHSRLIKPWSSGAVIVV